MNDRFNTSKLASALQRWQVPIALALLAALLLPGLGTAGLLDPWEMDRAAVSRRMAADPRVVVVESADGSLRALLEKQAPGHAFAHPFEQGEPTAAAAMQEAVGDLTRKVAHAVVIDVAGVAQATPPPRFGAGRLEALAGQIATMQGQNRGTAVLLLASPELTTELGRAVGSARIRQLHAGLRATPLSTLLEGDRPATALGPLLAENLPAATREGIAALVTAQTPSPWSMPVHKSDGQTVTVPWLEAAAVAHGLDMFGPSETAARLPGALLVLLAGMLVVFVAQRLWGTTAGWLALLVYATLPMTWGTARAVTFEAVAPLGMVLVAGGLALAAARKLTPLAWATWLVAGLGLLFLGKGLGGLAMGAGTAVAVAVVVGGARRDLLAAAVVAAAAMGAGSLWVLGDEDCLVLRSLRFTEWPFGGGVTAVSRDFAWFVGQLGFAVFPWGAALALGIGRLIGGPADQDEDEERSGEVALLLGTIVPAVVVAALIFKYNHFVAPVGPMAALIIAGFLTEIVAGKVSGRVLAVFVALATLLLHREIGKGADAVTRFIAFDPPLMTTGTYIWPEELQLPGALRAIALLSVLGFALGAARPMASLRLVVAKLRTAGWAAWTLGVLGIVWALDLLISLGTRLDVLLKTQANVTGYQYDRMWVTIQGMRPEVIAGAVVFTLLLVLAAVLHKRGELAAAPRGLGWLFAVTRRLQSPAVAVGVIAFAALALLIAGLSVFAAVRHTGVGTGLSVGLDSAAFAIPAVLGVVVLAVRRFVPAGKESLWAELVGGPDTKIWFLPSVMYLVALAGVGIGASQTAGTWTWAVLAAVWALALVLALVVVGHAQTRAAGYGWPLFGAGVLVTFTAFVPLATRFAAETPQSGEAAKYLTHALLTSADSGALLVVAAFVALNRLAAGGTLVARLVDGAVNLFSRLEQPRVATGALVLAGLVFSAGFGWSLLPGLSVHYSQKHLLVRIAEAGGAEADPSGAPRTFTYGSTKSGSDNNFYTASMPTLEDRTAVLKLLADVDVATRILDSAKGGAPTTAVLPGWSDANDRDHDRKRDAPAWFGIATSVEGVRVQVTGAGWTAGQWRGAQLTGPEGARATVVDSGANFVNLSQMITLTAGDPNDGAFGLDFFAQGPQGHELHSATAPVQRFVVVPKDTFSELNHAFREAHGRHLAVLDARSSRLVLAANHLQPNQTDENWLRKAILTQPQFDAEPSVRRVFVNFDNQIHLIGYKLAEASVARSQKYRLTLYWRVNKATPTSWKLFMHPHPLHADRWPLTAPDPTEDDNKPCVGCFQTDHWMPGDIIADSFEQEVPLGASSGPNDIILGWYNPTNDQRMPVLAVSGQGVVKHGDNRATIGQLQVR